MKKHKFHRHRNSPHKTLILLISTLWIHINQYPIPKSQKLFIINQKLSLGNNKIILLNSIIFLKKPKSIPLFLLRICQLKNLLQLKYLNKINQAHLRKRRKWWWDKPSHLRTRVTKADTCLGKWYQWKKKLPSLWNWQNSREKTSRSERRWEKDSLARYS